jgi:hypothetical protein
MNTVIGVGGHGLEFPSGTRALRGLYDPRGHDGAHDYDRLWRSGR